MLLREELATADSCPMLDWINVRLDTAIFNLQIPVTESAPACFRDWWLL